MPAAVLADFAIAVLQNAVPAHARLIDVGSHQLPKVMTSHFPEAASCLLATYSRCVVDDAAALLLVFIFFMDQRVICLSSCQLECRALLHRIDTQSDCRLFLDGLPRQQQMSGTATLLFVCCLHLCMFCSCNCSPRLVLCANLARRELLRCRRGVCDGVAAAVQHCGSSMLGVRDCLGYPVCKCWLHPAAIMS